MTETSVDAAYWLAPMKPSLSAAFWLLVNLAMVGLVALFLAAYSAFSQVMPSYQAFFAAILIEAGMVVEAIALARGRNLLAAVGMVISLVVSGTYNYVQVEAAGKLAGWPLYALALGPLSALAFLALAIGRELGEYEMQVAKWQADETAQAAQEADQRQAWAHEQEQRRQAAEQERLAAETERERMRIEAQRSVEMERLRLEAREKARAERRAAKAVGVPVAQDGTTAVPVAQVGTYQQFVMAQAARNGAGPMPAGEIMAQFGVPRRTAYNWLAKYKDGG